MLRTELDILKFWREKNIFQKSVDKNKTNEPFIFYDGPPFATGSPHWGHIIVSQAKDTMLRYQNQKGKYVPRGWGWDCHGVPIEKLAEKNLEITDKREIEADEIGIQKFNETCKNLVLKYDEEWRKTINRIGRWVDMDSQYRTMDNDYIESVWWGLGKLWEKGLVYEGHRMSLYSPTTGVPLSHTDIAMEVKYRDEKDEAPIARFKVKSTSAKKLTKQILEQIAYSYSEQLRLKNDLEKKILLIENDNSTEAKRTSYDSLINNNKPKYESFDWENQPDKAELAKKAGKLKRQYEVVLENIETLNNLKKILTQNYDISILAWTTTPWTLPVNVALGVGKDIDYSMFYLGASNELVILAEDRAIEVLSRKMHEGVVNSPEITARLKEVKDAGQYFELLGIDIKKVVGFKGKDLEGLEYEQLLENTQTIDSYEQRSNVNKVYTAGFADSQSGTGIIHIAPAYGPDDFELGKERNLPILIALNDHGEYEDNFPELTKVVGKNYLKANPIILSVLEKKGLLFDKFNYDHRLPFYDRDGSRLYYTVQKSWFIAETKLTNRSLELNEEINWQPETLKHGRFGKGLETAPDWSISRSRFWGTPLPIWQTEDKTRQIFIDSVEKLKKLAVNPIFTIINSREINADEYEGSKAVVFTDIQTKLPLGINATQYRSKHLGELRQQKNLNISTFANFAQGILEEVLELFEKYQTVQILFNDLEQRFWTTWLLTLHPGSKKVTKHFHFYKKVEPDDIEGYKGVGEISLLVFHRPYIDDIILEDDSGNVYIREKDVLDTWVDSGSMPFASYHYPFENKETVEKNVPASWILEGQDQTRGWFRVLHVLSTAIFDKPAFKNVNSHGLILAADGRKMSKSKKNFTDPGVLIEKFGADSVRNYLQSSTLLDLDSVSFKDQDLQTVFRDTTLLISNSIRFFEYVFQLYPPRIKNTFYHPLNRWLKIKTDQVVFKIEKSMNAFQMQVAAREVIPYLRDLSTWYIRRSKDLLETEGQEISDTLFNTLNTFSRAIASLLPFNAEKIWQVVRKNEDPESVHLTDYPLTKDVNSSETEILDKMQVLRDLISEIHASRKEQNIRVRQPLYVDLKDFKWEKDYLDLLVKECNLLPKDLSKTEGLIFEKKGDFGYIKVDLVIDEELKILGFSRDFKRGVQNFRKKQGYQPGQLVTMHWQLTEIVDEEILNQVLKIINWKELFVEVKWVDDLDGETAKQFEVKGLVKVWVK